MRCIVSALSALKTVERIAARASQDPSGWYELLAAYENAKDETAASDAQMSPENQAEAIVHGKVAERLASAYGRALDAVLLAPAPDLRALSKQLHIFNEWQVEDGWHSARKIVEQLDVDARSLIGEA